ncbi:uncharacterized protein LOC129837700 [Salvelinus fontinalis]|uniref:uncharacterized protein LOC129837700 n=1 Tax=Salvelinus fontinalis TaxID=8038 RepID=UPI0024868102|nr:uncharacterized protein LOC129837700 [Salvelinus fontinalis]
MPREPYSEYCSMRRTREGGEEYGASSAMSYIMDPSSRDWSKGSLRGRGAPFSPDTDGDVDGDPVELSGEDLELLCKRMELEIIEEQIAGKEMLLLLWKRLGLNQRPSVNRRRRTRNVRMLLLKDVTLKERVNSILRKRAWTNECRSNEAADQQVPPKLVLHSPKVVKSFVERMNESILRKDSIVKDNLILYVHEEEHPLKLKVALLEQRRNPTVNKEDKAAKGFQYILNVLNKGGGTSTGSQRLSTISRIYPLWERSCHMVSRLHLMASPRPPLRVRGRCPLAKGAPGLMMSSRYVGSIYSGVSPPYSGFSPIRLGVCCVKWSQQVAFCHKTTVSYKVEKEILGNIDSVWASSRLRIAQKTKSQSLHLLRRRGKGGISLHRWRKMRPEDEQKYERIQSLLQTIGLDLGVEELGRLNDRTQERLYGKKRDQEKKGGKKESVWEVEKEKESKKEKEESEKEEEEKGKDKEE